MAMVNAASLREEFEATRIAALRAAGKVSEEAVIRVLLLDILIVVLLEKTTHEPELRPAAVTDGQEREACREQRQGPEAEPADGRQPAQDHRRGNGRGLRRLRR